MSTQPLHSFNCDSCGLIIPPQNPRIRCLICRDYDLCANCGLGERFNHGHRDTHQTQVYKHSGGNGRPALTAASFINYTPPHQPSMHTQFPPAQPTQPPTPQGQNQQWQPFFLPDMTPSPTYVILMNDIFTHLDPMNNGNLEPETFSRFLDDMGYLVHENAWKVGLQTNAFGMSKESYADQTLKNALDLFSIEHVLLQRIQPAQQQSSSGGGGLASQFSRALHSSVPMQAAHKGPMPAITREGFIEFANIEFLSDPSKGWRNLSRCLRKYNLPKYAGWGDLPRSVFPAVPDPAMMQRVAGVMQLAQAKGSREIEAARAAAIMRMKGSQAAVDLISGTYTRTEYVYR